MNKQTGTIITIVVAVLTLCCSASCCLGGSLVALNETLGLYWDVAPAWGFAPCCLSILIWILPILLWVLLVRGKEDEVTDYSSTYTTEEYIEGTIE